MIRLNTLGEDAWTLLFEKNGETASAAVDVAWWDEDTMLVVHGGAGTTYRVERINDFDLLKAHVLTRAPHSGIQAGGRVWLIQTHFPPDTWLVTGELARGGPAFPPEIGSNAQLGDINQLGDAVVVTLGTDETPSVLKLMQAGTDRMQTFAAYKLARPPRISPCGRALSWISGDSPRSCEVMLDGKRGSVELPAPPLLTPRLFEFYDRWWVLSVSIAFGVTLTAVGEPLTGYQWIVPDPAAITDLDAILTDQVYVVFETSTPGRLLTWSEGLAPGMDMAPLVETNPIATALHALEAETAAQDAAGVPDVPAVLEFPNGKRIELEPADPDPNVANLNMQREIEQILDIAPGTPMPEKYVAPEPSPWTAPSEIGDDSLPEWEAEVMHRLDSIDDTVAKLAAAVEQIKIVHAHYPSSDPAINAIEAARAVGRVAQKMEAAIDGLVTESTKERVFSFRIWKWTFRGIIYSPKPEKTLERRDTSDFDE